MADRAAKILCSDRCLRRSLLAAARSICYNYTTPAALYTSIALDGADILTTFSLNDTRLVSGFNGL